MERKHEKARVIKTYALMPIEVNHTVKWLETVYILQERKTRWLSGKVFWDNKRFADKEEYEKWKKGDSDA